MIQVNALGDACPMPVVKTQNAIRELKDGGIVETLVDNEIAVENLTKMARNKGYDVRSEKIGPDQIKVIITVTGAETPQEPRQSAVHREHGQGTVVAISAREMGRGDDQLGMALLKSFLYALSQQDTPPKTILFYNGGAFLTCLESPVLEDLKAMASEGVEILTCGTCLNFYGLTDQLAVGEVGNMYDIVEKMAGADRLVKP